ncbi:ribosomal RNA processing protein 36 homolog [Penaeus indicus]|uniref:ribosomal RNA processing protein 36 homolog n=1 Tax=Penaeus indicus TaxID=29960 RepID=UPI00300D571F
MADKPSSADICLQSAEHKHVGRDNLLRDLCEKMGTKAFNSKVLKEESRPVARDPDYYRRSNKNRPSEMPLMRKKAPRMRFLDPHQKTKRAIKRDPRFDDLSGRLNMEEWQHKYQFISNIRKKEKEVLKKELKKEDNEDMKKRIKSIVQRMENQERQKKFEQKQKEVEKEIRREQMEALKQGIRPKFVTNKEKNLRVRAKHFETLKQENRFA